MADYPKTFINMSGLPNRKESIAQTLDFHLAFKQNWKICIRFQKRKKTPDRVWISNQNDSQLKIGIVFLVYKSRQPTIYQRPWSVLGSECPKLMKCNGIFIGLHSDKALLEPNFLSSGAGVPLELPGITIGSTEEGRGRDRGRDRTIGSRAPPFTSVSSHPLDGLPQ